MAEIVVSHGLCSAIRPKVMTALEDYEFKNLKVQAWAIKHDDVKDVDVYTSDNDKGARQHFARITVSDAAAAWAERLLWQSGDVWLESPKLNHNLEWTAPKDCKAGPQGTLGRGHMPTPWSEKKHQLRAPKPKKPAKPAKPSQRKPSRRSSILDFLRRL